MSDCKYKKTIQFYADGYLGAIAESKLERHIKNCQQCQLELIQLEEVSKASLEVAETAPDPEYWENFTSRLFHRIGSRRIEASVSKSREKIGIFPLRLAFYLVFVLAAFSTGIWVLKSQLTPSTAINLTEPASVGDIISADAAIPDDAVSVPVGDHALSTTPPDLNSLSAAAGNEHVNADDSQPAASDLAAIRDFSADLRPPVSDLSNQLIVTDFSNLSAFQTADQKSKFSNLSRALIDKEIMESADRSRLSKDNSTAARALKFNNQSSQWGYAKQISDSAQTAEQELYLLEIDLIKNK